MATKKTKGLALLLSLIMVLGLLPVAGSATSSAVNPLTVTWYTDSTFTVVSTTKTAATYGTMYEAFRDIASGDFATVVIGAGYRGDNTSFTMNQAATVYVSSLSATNTFGGSIVVDNSSAVLYLNDFILNTTGNGVNVYSGTLFLGSGASITGSSNGVYNRGGTVRFTGGKVSSYSATTSATTVGSPSYITSSIAVTSIQLTPSSATMRVGTTQQMTATVYPTTATNKNVTWWSSDNSVITVSNSGLVRAVGTGSAYVRATTEDGGFVATSNIVVNSSGSSSTVAVTGVTVSGSRTVNVGSTITLTATIRPSSATNKNLAWSSSNTSVATVNTRGVVTGVSAGTTTIRAITADGNYSSSLNVTVSEVAPAAAVSTDIARNTKLYLDGSSAGGSVARGSAFVQLRPNGSNAVQKNKMSVQVRAFNRLPEDGYSYLRYRLPWIYVDLGTKMTTGMENTDRIEVTVRRLDYSYGTMNSTIYNKWRSYSNKNVSGPWDISANSDEAAMTLRILLPSNIAKSKLRVLSWNGSSFVSMNTSRYSVVRIGTQYFVRINNVSDGVYAVVER